MRLFAVCEPKREGGMSACSGSVGKVYFGQLGFLAVLRESRSDHKSESGPGVDLGEGHK